MIPAPGQLVTMITDVGRHVYPFIKSGYLPKSTGMIKRDQVGMVVATGDGITVYTIWPEFVGWTWSSRLKDVK